MTTTPEYEARKAAWLEALRSGDWLHPGASPHDVLVDTHLVTWEGTPERLGQLLAAEAEVERLRAAIDKARDLLAPYGQWHEADEVLARALGETSVPRRDESATYKIVRFRKEGNASDVIKRGLTLEEAQAWCQDEDTHGEGWFDGYDEES